MKNDKNIIKSRKFKAANTSPHFLQLISVNVKAMIVSLIAAFFIIFVGVLISFSTKDPIKYSNAIAYTAIYLSFFLCGFISSKLYKQKTILGGLCSFAIYITVLFILSLIIRLIHSAAYTTDNKAIISLLAFPCSLIGAFFGNIRIAKRKSSYSLKRKK